MDHPYRKPIRPTWVGFLFYIYFTHVISLLISRTDSLNLIGDTSTSLKVEYGIVIRETRRWRASFIVGDSDLFHLSLLLIQERIIKVITFV